MTRIVYKKDLGGTFSSFSKATPTKTTRNLQIIGASNSRLQLRLTVPGVNHEKVLIFRDLMFFFLKKISYIFWKNILS